MIPSLRRLLPALLILPLAAHGAIVTTTADEDDGSLGGGNGISLREAVKYSTAGDTITFAPALSGRTIRLTLGEITIANSLTIDGSALPVKITLSGDKTGNGKTSDDTRIINIASSTVLLDSLILDRGYRTSVGAAIHVNNSVTQLTVRNSTISNNESGTYGGGIYFIGASNSPASFLKIQNCRLTGNYTGHDGGAIHMSGTLQVEDSTFSNNTAYQGCAIYNGAGVATVTRSSFSDSASFGYGGAIHNLATFTLRTSTISGNSAPSGGGGIHNASGTLAVENSTLTANSGTAIRVAGGAVSVRHATIVSNSGSICGGIYRTSGSLSVNQSIVAGNSGSPSPDISGVFTGTDNLIGGDPLLSTLADYCGPTLTMPPLPGSPAIDPGGTITLTTDQRGYPRDSKPDIGAAEYQGSSDLVHFWNLDSDGDGSPFGTEQALGTDPAVADPTHTRNLTAPALDASGHAVLSFGIGTAAPGTRWILRRSTDLLTFAEIYRYDGTKDSAAPGITFLRTSTGVTITDENPLPGSGFYRFESLLEP